MKHSIEYLRGRIDDVLAEMGGLYSFEDIVNAVKEGRMQSFRLNDSWAVTQISVFPQKVVLDIVFVFGDLEELELLYVDIMGWARERDLHWVMTMARDGWMKHAVFHGWKEIGRVIMKDLRDGS